MTSSLQAHHTKQTKQRWPRLGLVCITVSDAVHYRTITRTRLLQYDESEQAAVLHALYAANLERLATAIAYCRDQQIHLYRITSNLFPFADAAVGADILLEFANDLAILGRKAREAEIRLVMHPEQFIVLNSDSPAVVENSVQMLTHHALVMDLLEQPRSPWALLEIHGGKSGRAKALVETIGELPDSVRLRLALENDERAYSATQILSICQAAHVPMVFDAHHHIVKEGMESYEHPSIGEMVQAARATWPNPAWQVAHISNGRESFGDRRHSDLIDVMPSSYMTIPWIEVEAKHKEEAIAKLRRKWQGS